MSNESANNLTIFLSFRPERRRSIMEKSSIMLDESLKNIVPVTVLFLL